MLGKGGDILYVRMPKCERDLVLGRFPLGAFLDNWLS